MAEEIDAPVVAAAGPNIFLVVAIIGMMGWGGKAAHDALIKDIRRSRVDSLVSTKAAEIPTISDQLYALVARPMNPPQEGQDTVSLDAAFTPAAYLASLPQPRVDFEAPPKPVGMEGLVTRADEQSPEEDFSEFSNPKMDYLDFLDDKVRRDGIAGNGAFLNGRFFALGQVVYRDDPTMGADGIVAVLTGANQRYVTLTINGKKSIQLPLKRRARF